MEGIQIPQFTNNNNNVNNQSPPPASPAQNDTHLPSPPASPSLSTTGSSIPSELISEMWQSRAGSPYPYPIGFHDTELQLPEPAFGTGSDPESSSHASSAEHTMPKMGLKVLILDYGHGGAMELVDNLEMYVEHLSGGRGKWDEYVEYGKLRVRVRRCLAADAWIGVIAANDHPLGDALLDRVRDYLTDPFMTIASQLNPIAPPSSDIRTMLAGPKLPFFTSLIVSGIDTPPTLAQSATISSLSHVVPTIPIPPPPRTHHTSSSPPRHKSCPKRSISSFRPQTTLQLVSGLFDPLIREALREEVIESFLQWRQLQSPPVKVTRKPPRQSEKKQKATHILTRAPCIDPLSLRALLSIFHPGSALISVMREVSDLGLVFLGGVGVGWVLGVLCASSN